MCHIMYILDYYFINEYFAIQISVLPFTAVRLFDSKVYFLENPFFQENKY